jgi:hypothetical protein
VQITVQLTPEAAKSLAGHAKPDKHARALLATAKRHGVTLQPLFPNSGDQLMESMFQLDVPDEPTARRVLADLKKSPATQSAYLKPADALP